MGVTCIKAFSAKRKVNKEFNFLNPFYGYKIRWFYVIQKIDLFLNIEQEWI